MENINKQHEIRNDNTPITTQTYNGQAARRLSQNKTNKQKVKTKPKQQKPEIKQKDKTPKQNNMLKA